MVVVRAVGRGHFWFDEGHRIGLYELTLLFSAVVEIFGQCAQSFC